MTTIVEQQNKINELLNGGRPVTLETIAQALSVTAQEAAHLLPEGSATFAPPIVPKYAIGLVLDRHVCGLLLLGLIKSLETTCRRR